MSHEGDAGGYGAKVMESKSRIDPKAYVLTRIRNLTTEEAGELRSAPMATWLATVALVLIVISVALLLAAWREHDKKAPVAAQVTRLGAFSGRRTRFMFGFCNNVQPRQLGSGSP